MYQCEKCGKEFDDGKKLGGHKSACGKIRIKRGKSSHDFFILKNELNCKFCNGLFAGMNSLKQHEARCKENPNRSLKGGFIAYNEKMKENGIKRVNQFTKAKRLGFEKPIVSEETRNKISMTLIGKKHSNDRKEKQKLIMQQVVKNNPESYSSTNVNGRIKKVKYKDILLDSSWEMFFAIWCDDNQVTWERNKKGFEYQWNGKRIYYPDFYLPELDLYIEIKGYERDRDREKWKSVPNLLVLKDNEISLIKENKFKLEVGGRNVAIFQRY